MAMSVVVHIHGEDAFLGEIDDLPDPNHTYVLLRNIRKKDGKELPYVTRGATAFLYPWSRITFIETMGEVPGTAAAGANGNPGTTILGFFREEDRQS
ncbi:MAG: hypothetical protein ABR518_03250 [Actinomycetota bacterium]